MIAHKHISNKVLLAYFRLLFSRSQLSLQLLQSSSSLSLPPPTRLLPFISIGKHNRTTVGMKSQFKMRFGKRNSRANVLLYPFKQTPNHNFSPPKFKRGQTLFMVYHSMRPTFYHFVTIDFNHTANRALYGIYLWRTQTRLQMLPVMGSTGSIHIHVRVGIFSEEIEFSFKRVNSMFRPQIQLKINPRLPR